MANTEQPFLKGLRADEDCTEYYDTPKAIKLKVAKLCEALLADGDCVVFTGAGISTAANIPDYRGPQGVWTLQEQGLKPEFKVTIEDAQPTFAHRFLARMIDFRNTRAVVSTNVDGLHRKAGVPQEKLAELHGNLFMEQCRACDNKEFWRDFDVTKDVGGCQPDHKTGRTCDDCNGPLTDSIIHFKEGLSKATFEKAKQFATGSKTALVLGTSLRVRPASDLPRMAEKMFIVNLQKTPHDANAAWVIRARVDLVLALVAQKMGLECDRSLLHNWEDEYTRLSEDSDVKGRERSRLELQKMITPQLSAGIKPAEKFEHVGRKGEKLDVCPTSRGPVLIRNCSDCIVSIQNNNAIKLVLLDCTAVSVLIGGRLLSGVLEIINSTQINVACVKSVPTIQIDSSDVIVGFVSPSLFVGRIIASANSKLSVALSNQDSEPSRMTEIGDGDELTQYVCQLVDGELTCELVVREGNNYATTKREKEAADERDRRNEALIEKYLATLIK